MVLWFCCSALFAGEHEDALSRLYSQEDYLGVRQYADKILKTETDADLRAIALHYKALALYQQKQLPEALATMQEAKDTWTDKSGAQYAMSCNSLGNILEASKKSSEAINAYNEALAICKKLPDSGLNARRVMSALNNLAAAYLQMGKKNAATYLKQAAQVYREHPDETSAEYLTLLSNTGAQYSRLGDFATAANYHRIAAETKREQLGEDHPSYGLSLMNTAIAYYNGGLYNEATPYIKEYIRILRQELQRNFTVMTEQEREKYWNAQSDLLDKLLVTATYAAISDKNADASLLYDICLLSKSLLLDTSVQMEKIIAESNNPHLIQLRKELRQTQQALMEQEGDSKLAKETSVRCDSLERVLIQEVGILQDHLKQMQITWQDVRGKLKPNEMAVEFLHLGSNKKESEYAVVTLRHDWEYPHVTYINGLAQTLAAKQISRMEMHNNAIFGNLVWQTICQEANEGDRIWFVPAGELQLMGTEFFTIEKSGTRMCDRYEMHRLSSTKQVVTDKAQRPWNCVALIGGMDYNASIDEMRYYADEYRFRYTEKSKTATLQEKIWPNLPGTLREVQQVDELLKGEGRQTTLTTRDAATAAALHSFSDKANDILHIATHGFYHEGSKNAMTNSGLVMAGANTLRNNPVTELGSGVMTADEISKLDFRKTELVVLSACQTGVGEISTEGVFGLQRAFKVAGAECLLATLWEVNDTVTAKLMTSFYQTLTEGSDTYAAYRKAVESVRKSEGNDIALWGAFVLIDK